MKSISLGRHLLLEYYDCELQKINDTDFIRKVLLEAAVKANATIITDVFHRFNPHGVSGVVVIAESHLAIHTWPEHACASVDIFSCSDKMRPELIADFLKEAFGAQEMTSMELERGKNMSAQVVNL